MSATCPGFPTLPDGRFPGCGNKPGSPYTTIWCPECDKKRLAHLDNAFEGLKSSFSEGAETDD